MTDKKMTLLELDTLIKDKRNAVLRNRYKQLSQMGVPRSIANQASHLSEALVLERYGIEIKWEK